MSQRLGKSMGRSYVLVETQPGKEKESYEAISALKRISRIDFVHGSYDFVVILEGEIRDMDYTVMDIRKAPYVRKTETLLCFEAFSWEDLSGRLHEEP